MLPYYPALRAKPGEFAACGRSARRYQEHIFPRFVVPPPSEPDPEKGRPPKPDEIAYLMGERLGKSWPIRSAFIDSQFVAERLGDEGVEILFRNARKANPGILPVLTLSDFSNPARRMLIRQGLLKAGVYVGFEDADPAVLLDGLEKYGLRSTECVLFVDFTGAPLGENTAPVIGEIFDRLDNAAKWSRIVYQASAYPQNIPVGPNKSTLIPRDEWTTFLAALKETGVDPDRLAYGDFGADCGRMLFPKRRGGRPPIPHLRYTSVRHTLLVRGSDTEASTPAMRQVCREIIKSDEFSGRGFSYADDYIWRHAMGVTDTCGNSTHWREINTAHHLVRVVRDLSAISGKSFADDYVSEILEQGNLF